MLLWLADRSIILVFDLTTVTKFQEESNWHLNRWSSTILLVGRTCPHSKVWDCQHPKKFMGPHMYAPMVWPRATEFGTVTRGAWTFFYRVSHAPVSRGGVQHLPIFWNPYLLRNGLTYGDGIWYSNMGNSVFLRHQPRFVQCVRPNPLQIFRTSYFVGGKVWVQIPGRAKNFSQVCVLLLHLQLSLSIDFGLCMPEKSLKFHRINYL